MIKLVKKEELEGIWAGDMKDGDVAEIVAWSTTKYIGDIVQRYGCFLIAIGYAHGWGRVFGYDHKRCILSDGCRVRLLKEGETLIVV